MKIPIYLTHKNIGLVTSLWGREGFCQLLISNKNKLKFNLDDSNSEEDKVIIMVHKNNYRTSQVSNMKFYWWKSLTDRLIEYSSYRESKCILLE